MVYNLGFYLGYFVSGCIMGGVFPLIVALIKKRVTIGVAVMFGCGILGLISPVVSIVAGVVAGIALCVACKKPN